MLGFMHGGVVANWVQCSRYDKERTPIWINLDQVIAIRENSEGSTLVCPAHDAGEAGEIAVWDRPRDILARKAGSDY
jgi:hypothetical protein